jgi:hypothetical protein
MSWNDLARNDNGMISIGFWDWVWEVPLSPCVLQPKKLGRNVK